MGRYTEANELIGKFVPKVYTRRITLEDGMITEMTEEPIELRPGTSGPAEYYEDLERAAREAEGIENYITATNFQTNLDATIVTVDFFVRDLIRETDVEVLARNLMRGNAGDEFRNIVSDCLDVYVFAVSNRLVADRFHSMLLRLYQLAYEGQDPSVALGAPFTNPLIPFDDYIQDLMRVAVDFEAQHRGRPMGTQILKSTPIQIRRVDRYQERYVEEQFIRSNSQYERYDNSSNDLLEKLPGRHVFNISDLEFDNCDNLSIITFSRFDFEKLKDFLLNSGISSDFAEDLMPFFANMLSHPTHDIVTTSGKVKSEAVIFLDKVTRAPYNGPVHLMAGGYMTGYVHEPDSRALDLVTVPLTKIQDFRTMQRSRMVNFEAPEFGATGKIPDLSYLEKRNKNFFDLGRVFVEYYKDSNRGTPRTDMMFSVGLESIYKNNSRFYELLRPMRNDPTGFFANEFAPEQFLLSDVRHLLDLRSIRILRKRVSRRGIGTTRLGSPKKKDFIPYEEPVFSVVYRSNPEDDPANPLGGITRTTMTSRQVAEDGSRVRHTARFAAPANRGPFMDFYAADYSESLRMYHGTGAVLQYGVELIFKDRTRQVLQILLSTSREALSRLEKFSELLKIPVFRQKDMFGIAQANFFIPRSIGYYDYTTNSFVNNAEDLVDEFFDPNFVFNIDYIANQYTLMVALAFGATSVNVTKSSVNILQRDDTDEFGNNLTLTTLIDSGLWSFQDARDMFKNIINPRNSNPELLDSFIRQFRDTLETLENFLDMEDFNNPDAIYGGSGYTAKGHNHFTVQRWFNSAGNDPIGNLNMDDDNYVYMDPEESNLFYNYEPRERPGMSAIPSNVGQIVGDGEFQITGVAPTAITFGRTRFNFVEIIDDSETAEGEGESAAPDASFDAVPDSGTGMYEALNGLLEQINIRRNDGRDVQDVINSVDAEGQSGASDGEMQNLLLDLTQELRDDSLTPSVGFVFQNSPENEQKNYGDLCDIIDNTEPPYEPPDIDVLRPLNDLRNDPRIGITARGGQGTVDTSPERIGPADFTPFEFDRERAMNPGDPRPGPFDAMRDGQRMLAHLDVDGSVQPVLSSDALIRDASYILLDADSKPMAEFQPAPASRMMISLERAGSLDGGAGDDTVTLRQGEMPSPFTGRVTSQKSKKLSQQFAAAGSLKNKKGIKKISTASKTINFSGTGLSNGIAKKVEMHAVSGGEPGADSLIGGDGNDRAEVAFDLGPASPAPARPTASRQIPSGRVRNIRTIRRGGGGGGGGY